MQIGKTKVFLRAGQMAELDARRAEVLSNAAKTIQRRVRTHQARKQFIALRKATISVQSLWRGEPSKTYTSFINNVLKDIMDWLVKISCLVPCAGRLACKLFENLKREAAAVKIQKHTRKYHARKAYKSLHVSVLVFQTGLRAMAARNQFRFRKQTKAAIIIQVNIRTLCR